MLGIVFFENAVGKTVKFTFIRW